METSPQSLVVEPDVALCVQDGRLHAALPHDLRHLLRVVVGEPDRLAQPLRSDSIGKNSARNLA